MLALSVKQPWAELIARGTKKKEFRSWSRSSFGDLLIVASKSADEDAMDEEGLEPASLVYGRAVCVVEFFKVTGDEDDYAWHFRNPRRVEPVEIRGSASLYHVPDERIRFVGAARGEPAVAKPRKTVRVPPKRRPKTVRVPTCAACGASDVIPIVYGLPGPEMWEKRERGEIELGGCCVGPGDDPVWRCSACGEAFGVLGLAEFEVR
jgi:hypothetical protein